MRFSKQIEKNSLAKHVVAPLVVHNKVVAVVPFSLLDPPHVLHFRVELDFEPVPLAVVVEVVDDRVRLSITITQILIIIIKQSLRR